MKSNIYSNTDMDLSINNYIQSWKPGTGRSKWTWMSKLWRY